METYINGYALPQGQTPAIYMQEKGLSWRSSVSTKTALLIIAEPQTPIFTCFSIESVSVYAEAVLTLDGLDITYLQADGIETAIEELAGSLQLEYSYVYSAIIEHLAAEIDYDLP